MNQMRIIAAAAVALLTAGCNQGPAAPEKTVQQLMAEDVQPTAKIYWDAVQYISDENGTRDIVPQTDADWKKVKDAATRLGEFAELLKTPGYTEGRNADWTQFASSLADVAKPGRTGGGREESGQGVRGRGHDVQRVQRLPTWSTRRPPGRKRPKPHPPDHWGAVSVPQGSALGRDCRRGVRGGAALARVGRADRVAAAGSILAMLWLWRDTHDSERLAVHVQSTFWFVLPSLPMFLLVPYLLRAGYPFPLALACGCALTVALYLLMIGIGPRYGLKL
jgi:hypothetical protein